jgi:autotransporter-associated beta strand protein
LGAKDVTRTAGLTGLVLTALAAVAPAQTLDWSADGVTAGGTGSWTLLGINWLNAGTPQAWADGSTAVFGGTAGTVTIDGLNPAVAGLTFSVTNYTLQSNAGETLALGTGGVSVTTGDATVLTQITGAAAWSKTGAGRLILNADNSGYTGTITLSAGTLRALQANALGSGAAALTLAGGTLELANDANTTFGRNVTVTGNTTLVADRATSAASAQTHTLGTLTTVGARTITVNRGGNSTGGTGQITFGATTLGGNTTFTVNGNAQLNLTGTVSDGGSGFAITKGGGGLLLLSGTSGNTFSGGVTITGGTVQVQGNTSGSNLGTGTVTLTGGTLNTRYNGGGSNLTLTNVSNNFLLNGNATISVDRNSANTGNTMAFGSLTVSGNRQLTVNSGNGYIASFNGITLNGNLTLTGNGPVVAAAAITEDATPRSLTYTGSNRLTLTTANSFSGPLSVNGGFVRTTDAAQLGTNPTVNLGRGVLELRNDTNLTTWSQTINVTNDGVISVDRAGAFATGNTLRIGALTIGSNTVGVSGNNGYQLEVQGTTTVNGNSVFNAHGLVLNAVSGSGSLTQAGNGGGTLTLAGPATHTGGTNVTGGTLVVARNGTDTLGTGAVNVGAGGTLRFDPGGAGTATVAVPSVSVASGGAIVAGTGITDLGSTVVNLAGGGYVGGLVEGRIASGSNIDTATANPGNFGVRTGVRQGQSSFVTNDPRTGWASNETWVYTGEFFDADGIFSFGENVDDRVRVYIDGLLRLSNDTWNVATTTGSTTNNAAPPGNVTTNFGMGPNNDGWHTFEVRLHNGAGGAGAVTGNGWTANLKGFGLSASGSTSNDGANYVVPIDPGDASLFRSLMGAATLSVDAGATFRAGSVSGAGSISLNGGTLELVAAVTGTAASLTAGGGSTVNLAAGNQLDVQTLNVTSNILFKTGAGLLNVSNSFDLAAGTTLSVQDGTVLLNGTGTGTGVVVVGTSGTLGGAGTTGSSVTVLGSLAPGNSPGTLTVGELFLGSTATVDYELATPGTVGSGVNDLTQVNGNLTLDGTLNVTALTGFAAGTYRLFNYTGVLFDNGLDLGLMPGGFTYQVDTATIGQVNLIVVGATPIPEPAALLLLSAGLAGGALLLRRRAA